MTRTRRFMQDEIKKSRTSKTTMINKSELSKLRSIESIVKNVLVEMEWYLNEEVRPKNTDKYVQKWKKELDK